MAPIMKTLRLLEQGQSGLHGGERPTPKALFRLRTVAVVDKIILGLRTPRPGPVETNAAGTAAAARCIALPARRGSFSRMTTPAFRKTSQS
ncbi:hypothetical protein EVAR_27983_1 [Eumeta japonica]|uniref:Uncharacterized protein n=1 Tax=Eumeta variegata TaxID=151549 RepID=A0A4C1WEL2_EUMVA|nr:hypothetical protein EVAR_27983_1 [Eumeta japonica]